MSSGRIELNKLLSSNHSISFFYWVSLLNVFQKFQDELDIDDVRRLVQECERCRLEINKTITDKIEKSETNPDVYSHLEKLEANLRQSQTHKKESLPVPQQVAVAQ